MDASAVTSGGLKLQYVVSMAMLDKSMEFDKQISEKMLEGLDFGTPAAGEIGSIIDVYA